MPEDSRGKRETAAYLKIVLNTWAFWFLKILSLFLDDFIHIYIVFWSYSPLLFFIHLSLPHEPFLFSKLFSYFQVS